VCVQVPLDETEILELCMQSCTTPLAGRGTCRQGYVCAPLADPSEGVCLSDCNVDGFGNWNSYFGCNADGYECRPPGAPMAGYCCPTDGGTACF
jgi:hypothetical protein